MAVTSPAEKAISHEGQIPKYEIVAKKPSQLFVRNPDTSKMEFIPNGGLVDLVTSGYGIPNISGERLDHALESEYGGEDARRQIYLAYEGPRVVGSLTLGLWGPNEAKRGEPFWLALLKKDPGLVHQLRKISPLAVEVVGTVTLPSEREKGVSRQLWEKALADLNPSVVLGVTKNPNAVLARSHILGDYDFRTFLGSHIEVTPNQEKEFDNTAHFLWEAYLSAKGYQVNEKGAVVTKDSGLPTDIPSLTRFTSVIQAGLDGVVETQQKIGREGIALVPMISVRKEPLGKKFKLTPAA